MDVLLLGGTGFVGTRLAERLADRDHDVTALSRHPDDEDLPAGVETVAGDVTAYESIEGAFEGVDAVVNLVALSPLYKTRGDLTHDRIHRGGTENAVRAAEAHDVDFFVQLSALGADPNGRTAYIRAKGVAERIVRGADVATAIVRPSVVFGDGGEFVSFTKRTKRLFAPGLPIAPLPGGGETRFQPIHVDDLVSILAEIVENRRAGFEAFEIGGPEKLTLAEVTRLVFEAEGSTVRIVSIPMPLAGVGLTLGELLPGFPFGGDQYESLKLDNTVEDNDVDEFDLDVEQLTTLREYLGLTE